ncbi:hypothetical protein [Mycobacterium simiae]|uniref:hypothetical protein n=1 Tax=Mycobacterium simiae TaxID=1784 RepID=UPI0011F24F4E|nr:hypothetical protein [Mycobacterium simiae]
MSRWPELAGSGSVAVSTAVSAGQLSISDSGTIVDTAAALNALRSCRDGRKELRLDASTAAAALTGARGAGVSELAKMIADGLATATAWRSLSRATFARPRR